MQERLSSTNVGVLKILSMLLLCSVFSACYPVETTAANTPQKNPDSTNQENSATNSVPKLKILENGYIVVETQSAEYLGSYFFTAQDGNYYIHIVFYQDKYWLSSQKDSSSDIVAATYGLEDVDLDNGYFQSPKVQYTIMFPSLTEQKGYSFNVKTGEITVLDLSPNDPNSSSNA